MSPIKLEYGRYVSNKLWNLFRFYINYSNDIDGEITAIHPQTEKMSTVERYIINKSEGIAREIENHMNALNVESSCQIGITFLLNSVCDL